MKYNFRNLVFEGGGVKGMAYAGALKVLEEKDIMKNIENAAGTSAGAITAALVALNFSASEIQEILAETNFSNFKDDSPLFFPNIYRLFTKFGWFKGNKFESWFERIISQKVNTKITFSQLSKMKTGKKLFLVGANLDKQKAEIFSHETTPNMQISKAVRISMSIPLFFKAVENKKDIFVDGGIYYNYPINLFDDKVYNKETLGLRVDTNEEVSSIKLEKEISSLKSYIMILIGSIIDMANKIHLKKEDWERTIYINVGNIRATQFDLTEKQKEQLIKAGEKYAKKYFEWFDGKR